MEMGIIKYKEEKADKEKENVIGEQNEWTIPDPADT